MSVSRYVTKRCLFPVEHTQVSIAISTRYGRLTTALKRLASAVQLRPAAPSISQLEPLETSNSVHLFEDCRILWHFVMRSAGAPHHSPTYLCWKARILERLSR
jgi:hypothetical protein